ncbi:MAG: TOBE domain-containing protein [Planctomycetota bacterium]
MRKVPRKEIEERVNWAAKTLGLEELLKCRPKQLSGGQRQRVAVGRAIVRQPQVFLFDEPLSNLDAKLRVSTRAELKRLQQELRTTTIYVTHDQEEAMTLGDRVVVMNRGVIHQCGTPLEVYRNPVDRFVAGFFGMPPMNFVDGKITRHDDDRVFEGGGISIRLDPSHHDAIDAVTGQNVSLGLRPEVARLCGDNEENAFPVSVEVVEILGAVMDLYVRTAGDKRLVCRVNTDQIQAGQQVHITVDKSALHIFEPNSYGSDPEAPEAYGKNLTAVST